MFELMKSMQEEMRTHGVKMDAETKAVRDKLDAHQEKTRDRPETKGNPKQD
jgi:hypothetical protein